MKELKYNFKFLFKRKELYMVFIGVLLINLLQILSILLPLVESGFVTELTLTGEYQYILYRHSTAFQLIILIVLPILCSMIFADSSWVDSSLHIDNAISMRLNPKKLIITRWFLSILIVFVIVFIALSLNYVTLVSIFESGNRLTSYHTLAYNMRSYSQYFLENVRLANPILFTFLCIAHISIVVGLLSAFTYSISFFIKYRILVYFTGLAYFVVNSMILSLVGFPQIALSAQLGVWYAYGVKDVLINYTILLFSSILPLIIRLLKKDSI